MSGSVWKSNPLGALFIPPTGFEDQGPHQRCKHSRRFGLTNGNNGQASTRRRLCSTQHTGPVGCQQGGPEIPILPAFRHGSPANPSSCPNSLRAFGHDDDSTQHVARKESVATRPLVVPEFCCEPPRPVSDHGHTGSYAPDVPKRPRAVKSLTCRSDLAAPPRCRPSCFHGTACARSTLDRAPCAPPPRRRFP